MSAEIDRLLGQGNIIPVLTQCLIERQYYLGLLLAKIYQTKEFSDEFTRLYTKLLDLVNSGNEGSVQHQDFTERVQVVPASPTHATQATQPTQGGLVTVPAPPTRSSADSGYIRVMMYCNWCDSRSLCNLWNKMSQGNYTWNKIKIVWEEPADWYVVVNCPPIGVVPDPAKTVYFAMEPHMAKNKHMWGEWANPESSRFKYCGTHQLTHNNNEWHLGKTYQELTSEIVVKDESLSHVLSTVLSDKYKDPGHVKRIDFIKYIDNKNLVTTHVFGGNRYKWKNYKGSPPSHCKDQAMFPYKYVFNAENFPIRNYYTEKLIDGILAECLVFYWGCPNIKDWIDERAYVKLDLVDMNKDMNIIKKAMEENWWEQRLPFIREAKRKILNEQQFFPRLEKILSN